MPRLTPLGVLLCVLVLTGCTRRGGPIPYAAAPLGIHAARPVIDCIAVESGGGKMHIGGYLAQGVTKRQAATRLLHLLESESSDTDWIVGGWSDANQGVRMREALYGCLKQLCDCTDCAVPFYSSSVAVREEVIRSNLPKLRDAVSSMGPS